MKRAALALCIVMSLAVLPGLSVPGWAGEPAAALGTSVEMPFLIAPMADSDGKLLSYAYISMKVVGASQSAAIDVREKLAFIQDAFVRDVNAAPITLASDPNTVDKVALRTRLLANAKKIVGGEKVRDLTITQVQIAAFGPAAR